MKRKNMLNTEKISKPELTGIRNILFDLGNVLLNLDFMATIKAFRRLGLDEAVITMDQAYADPVFYELETGRTNAGNFRNKVRELLNNKQATDRQIDEAWCAMIRDVPVKRVQTLKKLAEKYKVYLFSNTNEIHISYFHEKFKADHGVEFSSLFVKDYYSHQLQERKPDKSSYLKMLDAAGIDAHDTLFVDDLEKNIRGAREAGLKTFWLSDGMEVCDLF